MLMGREAWLERGEGMLCLAQVVWRQTHVCLKGLVPCPLTQEAWVVALAGRGGGGLEPPGFGGKVSGLGFVPPRIRRMLRAG